MIHDRRVPGSRTNIDYLAITPSGMWVIDAKRYARKRPQLKIERGILRPRVEKIMVGGRDRTTLVDGVLKQIGVVREVLGEVPVTGVMCFVDADWPMIGGDFTTRGVHVLWPKRLIKLLRQDGPTRLDVHEVSRVLRERLRPA